MGNDDKYQIGDKIIWRYKDNKGFSEGYIKDNLRNIVRIADSNFGLGIWYRKDEIEIEKLDKTAV